ncbi:MAG: energy transducer TonB [Crocinitomicaceae bacterium]|nr:energy transducer TonB [Crocinitomicaceae bacterium]
MKSILFLTLILCFSFTLISQATFNERVTQLREEFDLKSKFSEKLTTIRNDIKLDKKLQRDEWLKYYEKWDPTKATNSLNVGKLIVCEVNGNDCDFKGEFLGYSNEYLLSIIEDWHKDKISIENEEFLLNILWNRSDMSKEEVKGDINLLLNATFRFSDGRGYSKEQFSKMGDYVTSKFGKDSHLSVLFDGVRAFSDADILEFKQFALNEGISYAELEGRPQYDFRSNYDLSTLNGLKFKEVYDLFFKTFSRTKEIKLPMEKWKIGYDQYVEFEPFLTDQYIQDVLLGLTLLDKWRSLEIREFKQSLSGKYLNDQLSGNTEIRAFHRLEQATKSAMYSSFWTRKKFKTDLERIFYAAKNDVYFILTKSKNMSDDEIDFWLRYDLNEIQLTETENAIIDRLNYDKTNDVASIIHTESTIAQLSHRINFRLALYIRLLQNANGANESWYKKRLDHLDEVANVPEMDKIIKELGQSLYKSFCSKKKYWIMYNGVDLHVYPEITRLAKIQLRNTVNQLIPQDVLEPPRLNYARFVVDMSGFKSMEGREIDLQNIKISTEIEENPAPELPPRVFVSPDEEASFPGGSSAMNQFINNAIQYPEVEWKVGDQGRVYIGFVVNEDGHLSEIEVVKGGVKELNKEAIRIVKSFPKFIPAKKNGEPVSMRMVLPFTFTFD